MIAERPYPLTYQEFLIIRRVMYPGADTATVSFLLPRSRRAGLEYRRKGAGEWTKLWQYTTFQKKTDVFFRFELKGLERSTSTAC